MLNFFVVCAHGGLVETVAQVDSLLKFQFTPVGKMTVLTFTRAANPYGEGKWKKNGMNIDVQTLSGSKVRIRCQGGDWQICDLQNRQQTQDRIASILKTEDAVLAGDCFTLLQQVQRKKDKKLKDYAIKECIAQVAGAIPENTRLMDLLALEPALTPADLAVLPPGSFGVQFRFALVDHWFSRDDHPFSPLDNPVRKETVFKVPEMGGSGWKGVFRNACRWKGVFRNACLDADEAAINRLFGQGNEGNENGGDGRLYFFSSFFRKESVAVIEPYVINPHSRKTKAGKNPILFEVVAPESQGRFTLLYVAKEVDKHLAEDRQRIATLIKRVFTKTGFGAKTGVGFGRARIVPMPKPPAEQQAKAAAPAMVKTKSGAIKISGGGGLAGLGALLSAKANLEGSIETPAAPLPDNRVMTRSACKGFDDFAGLANILAALDGKEAANG
jgi:hypothetical protein